MTTPNVDTLYSGALLDLRKGPIAITLPATGARYVSLALLDMYSNNFAVLGSRTTGPNGARVLLVGPEQPAPAGALRSPTPWVWALIRVFVDGPDDLAAAHQVQDAFGLEAASGPPDCVSVEPNLRSGPWTAYFQAAQALILENPPPVTDAAFFEQTASLGLSPQGGFDAARFTPAEAREIEAGVEEARALCRNPSLGVTPIAGWSYQAANTGAFGQDYRYRARIALSGLAALPQAEAMYMAAVAPDGQSSFDAASRWRLSFAPGATPPVDAFWSLTLYGLTADGQAFLVDNPASRYAIGGSTPGLTFNGDGSLDLWIQSDAPPPARRSNWLPAPSAGRFGLLMRAYLPTAEFQARAYVMPPVRRA